MDAFLATSNKGSKTSDRTEEYTLPALRGKTSHPRYCKWRTQDSKPETPSSRPHAALPKIVLNWLLASSFPTSLSDGAFAAASMRPGTTRQRSFFDQNHNAKPRPRWQNYNQRPANEVSCKPAGPKPPIAISSKTKRKLEAFTFEDPRRLSASRSDPRMIEPDKENDAAVKSDLLSRSNAVTEASGPMDMPPEKVAGNGLAPPPQTPASRLPLADLIAGSGAHNGQDTVLDVSPDERVYWQHTRSPRSSDRANITPGSTAKRGKKRARSSSPASSPHLGSDERPRAAESLNLQTLQSALRTPQADPVLDLWNRYAVGNGNQLNWNASPTPANVQLVGPGITRNQAISLPADGVAGLRRSLSCGMEWPTSKAKKRKIGEVEDQGAAEDVFHPSNPETSKDKGRSKLSRVSLLVQKVQESLAKPPSPQAKKSKKDAGILSRDRKSALDQSPGTEGTDQNDPGTAKGLRNRQPGPRSLNANIVALDESGESEKSEMHLRLLGKAENNTMNLPGVVPTNPLSAAQSEEMIPAVQRSVITTTNQTSDDSDEFGGIGEFFDAADLEEVAARYDAHHKSMPGVIDKAYSLSPSVQHPGDLRPVASDATGFVPALAIPSKATSSSATARSVDEEFGDMDDSEFDLAVAGIIGECAETTGGSMQTHHSEKARAIKRYLTMEVNEGQYTSSNGRSCPEKILLVRDQKNKVQRLVILRQGWYETPCKVGAFIHLIGGFGPDGQCVVDNERNMIILHPDQLISSTVVADSFACTRRAVLQDRVKATSEASPPQVYGHILHEIFQEAMKANRWDTEWLHDTIQAVVTKYITNIYEIKVELAAAVNHLQSKMPTLQAWAKMFVSAKPKPQATIKDSNGNKTLMAINKLLDVEEHVWSPMYGLKGNIDATVQIALEDENGQRNLTVPFEVKTGRNTTNASHVAQTALYTLLLSDRYDIDINDGILYYLETAEVSRVPAIRHQLRDMIMQRNVLACYVHDRLALPPLLQNPHTCGRCYAKVPCFVYHKLVDNGTDETSGMKGKFDELVHHLRPEHATFFKRWDDLLTKEEIDSLKYRRELWTMLSSEREALGRCFGNVVIEPGSAREEKHGPKINKFSYILVKQTATPGFSFTDSQLAVGEPIVISDEKGHFALANGYVTQVRRHRIHVAVDRRLHNARVRQKKFHETRNQVFNGIMEVTKDGSFSSDTLEPDEPVLFRLDKDEFNNGMATARNNLIQIMSDEKVGSRAIRSLVVEGKSPTFKPFQPPTALFKGLSQGKEQLNIDQKNAIERVMSANNYALVLGMPGTGKTTTIAHIIRALVSQGKSVLLTSYTHTAVDNILLKVRQDNISILRLGVVAKVHPEVQEFAILADVPPKSTEELRQRYHNPNVVATTCLGINHSLFQERFFDYCIVDEASQITLPVCLGPIRMAGKFVLVGDHNQLPPLVQNQEAREGGLDISLFKLLSDRHPESVVHLEHQYRMSEDIMSLSNELIYKGRLKCGNEDVADRSLAIPHPEGLKLLHFSTPARRNSAISCNSNSSSTSSGTHLSAPSHQATPCSSLETCFLRYCLLPSTRVCFLNTDSLRPASAEEASGSRIVNPTEATVCTQLVSALLATGVPASAIGVISIYRSQLALLKRELQAVAAAAAPSSSFPSASPSSSMPSQTTSPTASASAAAAAAAATAGLQQASAIEMHTADKFQGRDKDVIVLSLVRSNDKGSVGDLLRDWRRVNVALTRARSKLLIVGSRATLAGGDELLAKMLGMMGGRGWVRDLPVGVMGAHGVPGRGGVTPTPESVEGKEGLSPKKKVEDKENAGSPRKVKRGKVTQRAILGTRPVLRDIVNNLR